MTDAPENPLPHEPLSIVEARVLGCLFEKEATTPDYYPLSLNALVNACNQRSNRHPILELDEEAVTRGIESLRAKGLARVVSEADARVPKFRHSIDSVYPLPDPQRAILAELLLRGPQTVGELRGRCERMTPLESLDQVRDELAAMSVGATPIVKELPRQPGKKDTRFAQLLCGQPDARAEQPRESDAPLKVSVSSALSPEAEARIAALEAAVAELRAELAAFRSQFE